MRRQLRNISLSTLLLLLVAGCGESSNKSVFGESDAIVSLYAGQEQQIQDGDRLVPDDANTKIRVRHVLDDDTKYVTILEGSATLLRGQYAFQ